MNEQDVKEMVARVIRAERSRTAAIIDRVLGEQDPYFPRDADALLTDIAARIRDESVDDDGIARDGFNSPI